eukprot:134452-Prorocentrum_minimum.AAC.3
MHRIAASSAECRSAALRAWHQIRSSAASTSRDFSQTLPQWSRGPFTGSQEAASRAAHVYKGSTGHHPSADPSPLRLLIRPVLFTGTVTLGGLAAAAVLR